MAAKKKIPSKSKAAQKTRARPSAKKEKKECFAGDGSSSCGCLPTNEPIFSCATREASGEASAQHRPCRPMFVGQPQYPLPIRAKIVSNVPENEKVALLTFDVQLDAAPGQFMMVWLPGQEEKPMSIAETKPSLQLAIARAGPASTKMANAKAGEFLFMRGPLGQGYTALGKRWLLVGGGYGFAPLRFIARIGKERGVHVESINGARTKGLLMRPAPGKNHPCTDDGSAGAKGNVLAVLTPLLKNSKWDCVYCCGPEKMMEAVARACQKAGVPSQLSVERYMKCGFGVCGHCAMGGWLSCWDGPAIWGADALANPEFGKYHKDKAGRHINY